MDRTRWSGGNAGQIDGEAGWWISSGNTGLTPLARVKGVGRQQQVEMKILGKGIERKGQREVREKRGRVWGRMEIREEIGE